MHYSHLFELIIIHSGKPGHFFFIRLCISVPMGTVWKVQTKYRLQMFLLSALRFPSGSFHYCRHFFFRNIITLSILVTFERCWSFHSFTSLHFHPDPIPRSSDTDFSSQSLTSPADAHGLWCLAARSQGLMCLQYKPMLFVYDELNRRPGGTSFTKQEIAWRGWISGLSGGSRTLLSPLKRDLCALLDVERHQCFLFNSTKHVLCWNLVKVKPRAA